ncbi:GH24956 [Drosophila grimshawi]|uniref:GH24956 n=1 Tax=Drosophila grimshawi TaxID=7222 RepID=B4K2N9_DROGR|nr:GH24956 [Drosophila grimshawi]
MKRKNKCTKNVSLKSVGGPPRIGAAKGTPAKNGKHPVLDSWFSTPSVNPGWPPIPVAPKQPLAKDSWSKYDATKQPSHTLWEDTDYDDVDFILGSDSDSVSSGVEVSEPATKHRKMQRTVAAGGCKEQQPFVDFMSLKESIKALCDAMDSPEAAVLSSPSQPKSRKRRCLNTRTIHDSGIQAKPQQQQSPLRKDKPLMKPQHQHEHRHQHQQLVQPPVRRSASPLMKQQPEKSQKRQPTPTQNLQKTYSQVVQGKDTTTHTRNPAERHLERFQERLCVEQQEKQLRSPQPKKQEEQKNTPLPCTPEATSMLEIIQQHTVLVTELGRKMDAFLTLMMSLVETLSKSHALQFNTVQPVQDNLKPSEHVQK